MIADKAVFNTVFISRKEKPMETKIYGIEISISNVAKNSNCSIDVNYISPYGRINRIENTIIIENNEKVLNQKLTLLKAKYGYINIIDNRFYGVTKIYEDKQIMKYKLLHLDIGVLAESDLLWVLKDLRKTFIDKHTPSYLLIIVNNCIRKGNRL